MQTISAQELKQKLDRNEDFVLLNVLDEDSFQKEHIPQSGNIPLDEENFVEKVEQNAGSKDAEIILYCASVECPASEKAYEKLEEAGFSNLYEYEGGMKTWKEENLPVERSV